VFWIVRSDLECQPLGALHESALVELPYYDSR